MGELIAAVFGFPLIDIHTTAETTVAEIAAQLVAASETPAASAPEFLARVLWRDELGSVDLGHGEAILHARHPALPTLGGVVGRCVPPFLWRADASQPVHLVVLVYGPQACGPAYLHRLEEVVRLIIQIRNAPNCDGVVHPAAH